jgi:hypothetical protein
MAKRSPWRHSQSPSLHGGENIAHTSEGRHLQCFQVRQTERVTREMIQDIEFVRGMIDTNLAFLKSIPNSVQYWSNRKDFFLTETWLRDPDSVDTADFSRIASKCCERNDGRGDGVAVYISRVNLERSCIPVEIKLLPHFGAVLRVRSHIEEIAITKITIPSRPPWSRGSVPAS